MGNNYTMSFIQVNFVGQNGETVLYCSQLWLNQLKNKIDRFHDSTIYFIFFLQRITVDENDGKSVIAKFTVPCDAKVADISTIVVIATSDLDGTQNSADTTLRVISKVY